MTLRPDGRYHCDRCGIDVGNASVSEAGKVATVLKAADGTTTAVVYDLCTKPRDDAPTGCIGVVLDDDALADYRAQQQKEATSGRTSPDPGRGGTRARARTGAGGHGRGDHGPGPAAD